MPLTVESMIVQTTRLTQLSYELPNLVKSQIKAWTATAQSAAVTTLFASTSSQLLGSVPSDMKLKTGPAITLLRVFSSYTAMLFNLIATVAALFLIDRLGDIDLNQARTGEDNPCGGFVARSDSSLKLLRRFGARRHLKWIFFQWMTYLFLGILFLFIQAIMYMWVREGRVMSTVVSILTVPAIVVLLLTTFHEG
ncbi:hypothetical protein C8R43DRAFT_1138366 [Mycena crocata]|nr:hypothetical protein C8R43DRAFT_1138366 [Mycena crocata]